MKLVFQKNEKSQIYFILALLLVLIFIAGVYFVHRYLWYILILLGSLLIKGVNILLNKVIPVIKLDDKSLTILKENEENHLSLW